MNAAEPRSQVRHLQDRVGGDQVVISISRLHKESSSVLLALLLTLLLPFALVSPAHAIVNGRAAVALRGQVQIWVGGQYVCTGTLLSTNWVLTAAHCLNEKNASPANTQIFLGDLRLGQGENHAVGTFSFAPSGADAALIELPTPTTQSWQIARYGTDAPPNGALVTIRGWGTTSLAAYSPASTLQIASLGVSNNQYLSSADGPAGSLISTLSSGSAIPNVGDSGAGITYLGLVCAVLSSGNNSGSLQISTKASYASWIQQTTGIAAGGSCSPQENTADQLTCDIYAAGSTPCVAAHSMTRALFFGYGGPLYQVQRASDNRVQLINALSTGYADAATQDSFCAGTQCIVTLIYDQTGDGNDLVIEGPGGTVKTADVGAVANALPVSLKNNKVYGLDVTSGVGYRNNVTYGVAKGSSPEGLYMVTSGTNVNGAGSFNGGCCFDYGNGETNSTDNGNGHMDAINFSTFCTFPPCSGSGPWVEADLENGLYQGNGSNPNDQTINSNFVTAMLKNDGRATFALKSGNSQSGGLTTQYSGSLPTSGGYTPMNLEGGIMLGTGGDNSDWGVGSFFEGAMTSGYPTDATEAAVQANIVAAGYGGNSNPGGSNGGGSGGGGNVNEPPGPYTGPNDPGGPGPQDGFGQPANEQPNDLMATKPALASFKGSLYAAFGGVNANNNFYVTSSPTGGNFPAAARYTNISMGSAPALAVFSNQLFAAFQANDSGHSLYITSSLDGANWPTATQIPNVQIGSAPAMAVFRHQLVVAFQANDPGHTLHVTSSSDGVTWPAAAQIPNVQIGSAPAMAVFNSKLYVAFRANDPSNDVWIASSSDGVTFSSQSLPGQTMGGNSAPALVVSNNTLYYIYGANDSDNEMLVSSTTDGVTWQGPAAYLNDKMGPAGPGAAAFANGVSVGFQSNDSRNVLFVTNKVTEASTYTGPAITNTSLMAAEQPNDVTATKPALASFNGSLYAAFQGVNAGDDLYITSSQNGSNFPAGARFTDIYMGSAPAMTAFNNQLFVAFQADDPTDELFVTSSKNGTDFPRATGYPGIAMGSAPAMTVFKNQLYLAFQADDPSHNLFITSSTDGVTWPPAHDIANNGGTTSLIEIGSAPSIAVFNNKLYVAYRANDTSNNAFIASSSDGTNFTYETLPGQTMGGNSAPALAVSNNTLYYIYGGNDAGNEMVVSSSTDGTTWQQPLAYLGIQLGPTGPAAASLSIGSSSKPVSKLYIGFQANNPGNFLFVTGPPN